MHRFRTYLTSWIIGVVILSTANLTFGQTPTSYLPIENNGITSLIDDQGNVMYLLMQSGQTATFLDRDGNTVYRTVRIGQQTTLVDNNGAAKFIASKNGQYITLLPIPPKKHDTSEIDDNE